MATVRSEDRLRSFIDLVLDSLEEPLAGAELARRAYLSRFHFDRLVSAALRESPGRLRRRLLLERAAWQLAAGTSVMDAALDADFRSPEAFARAFRRAFGVPPSRHRAAETDGFWLGAPNGVHFHPPAGLFVPGDDAGRHSMDLTERLLEHDLALTRELLEAAGGLEADDLDWPLDVEPLAHEPAQPTIRGLLHRLVFTKEVWTAAMAGRAFPEETDTSLEGLRRRLEETGPEFIRIVRGVRDRGDWDAAFVDALCDPPESFTYGAMASHVLNFSAYRRQVLVDELQRRGGSISLADPIRWERTAGAARR